MEITVTFEYKERIDWSFDFRIAKDYKDDFLEVLQKWFWKNVKVIFEKM